ncbi:ornithine aminotransferase, putative [Perkinsus marinus ATCC 50983]|uniref:Ornithine aminotransferase, putative n=1 Tax=Perkinsus marinus (strain ATCC 50983 / TXsc) TaxID=423536 RepID=C5L0X8_PERM5|nr:ornithine aminotransferase, putative [Perkinsus marinus ATCC 50983]EER09620.1 ornithine aminotransferase, putative [Perkinsus marinus ATCC 50983]|eukprot:XP_002777825.1 ornithine aminotransferase, putative [Perkinsus marinus ATCC 50983]
MSAVDSNDLLAGRKKNFASSLSVSYANVKPLTMIRAKGQYMYDDKGQKYLDCRNNVPHIGHCDDRVVGAVSEMIATISTNTRYLHPVRQELAQELLKKFPAPLNKVFLVNSGSEANDLALRLARAYTKNARVVAVERGYHGTTSLTISVSAYKLRKFKQGSSTPQPDWVSIIPCPSKPKAAAESLLMLEQEARRDDQGLCAFICESGMSVAGVVLPPDGYMREAYETVRKHGGVCIADEVQVGLGRMGTHFWGFEQQGVVPDIVTIGKPLGNGFPVAAVVTTANISAAFDDEGVEYFSTFGGNTVSCAAALAVLRAIDEDNLQGHARYVGEVLKGELRRAARECPHIGEVRGSGLFVGVEIVEGSSTENPAPLSSRIASQLVARLLLDHSMLTTLDGPGDGVLVIKPPMCFTEENARELVHAVVDVI